MISNEEIANIEMMAAKALYYTIWDPSKPEWDEAGERVQRNLLTRISHVLTAFAYGLSRVVYEDGGVIRQDIQKMVEDTIRQYPNMDAPNWLGGVAAITTLMTHLGLDPILGDDEDEDEGDVEIVDIVIVGFVDPEAEQRAENN